MVPFGCMRLCFCTKMEGIILSLAGLCFATMLLAKKTKYDETNYNTELNPIYQQVRGVVVIVEENDITHN